MKQAIAGVTPASEAERTVMVTWPSIAAYGLGRVLGRGYNIKTGPYIFTVGNVTALLTIPIALALYFFRLSPSMFGSSIHGSKYVLTNRRILEVRSEIEFIGKFPFLKFRPEAEVKSVELDRFDSVQVVRQPGQEWYDAGDLVFTKEGIETFRLDGVSRPEAFRQTCVKSQMSYVGVKQALQHAAANA